MFNRNCPKCNKDLQYSNKQNYKLAIEKNSLCRSCSQKLNREKNINPMQGIMYGKPSPEGSGNGWSGWYKGFYFRSLMELSFIKLMIDNDIKIKSGEKEIFSIKYYDVLNNKHKTYFADYYLPEFNLYVEIKPKKLVNTYLNKLKFLNMKRNFIIITEKELIKISNDEIKQMYLNKDIIFINRYEQKFKEKFLCKQ